MARRPGRRCRRGAGRARSAQRARRGDIHGRGDRTILALDHPAVVDSLTLISTTAGAGDADLPSSSPELSAYFSNPAPEPDWSDHAAVVEYIVEECRHYAAPSQPFDDEAIRQVAARAIARTTTSPPARRTTHWPPAASPGGPGSARSPSRPWCCTAPRTRCSRSSTAPRWPGRSREPSWSPSSTPDTSFRGGSGTSCWPP